jgi:plasmid stabilization system protein ParE
MKILFDDEALEDLRGIHAWIAKESPRAANELTARIFDRIEKLLAPELTYMGRPGLDPGTH